MSKSPIPLRTSDEGRVGMRRSSSACLNFKQKTTFWAAGRPPWFNAEGDTGKPLVIGVSGGTSSGKTTLCHKIVEEINVPWAVILSQDSFYKDLEGEDLERARENNYNFDHPDSFDYDLMVSTLMQLKEGKSVTVPIYDFTTHKRSKATQRIYGADVILFEGILVFWNKELLDLMDIKVFVDLDSDIRLARRLRRDIAVRGRDFDGVLEQYERFVKPSFDEFIAPTKNKSNIIIPNGTDNVVAIDLLTEHIKLKLRERRGTNMRGRLLKADQDHGSVMPSTLHIMPETKVTRSIHTIMRDQDTPRQNFVFQATRLARLLVEFAHNFLPFDDLTITTPTQTAYTGTQQKSKVIGVSIMRAGESMEIALREVVKDIIIGKILIQSHPVTGTPQLIYSKLPDLSDAYVLLLDPMVGTGATALMAIRVLLDHSVREDHIFFLTLVAAPVGVHNLAYAFPEVTILTTALDERVDDRLYIMPGVGNFGDRYFGTE